MSFKISDKHFLKMYSQIWKRVEKLLEIELDSEPVYGDDDKYIIYIYIYYIYIYYIYIYDGMIINYFQSKKMPKEKAQCKCLSIIMRDSVIKAKKK